MPMIDANCTQFLKQNLRIYRKKYQTKQRKQNKIK